MLEKLVKNIKSNIKRGDEVSVRDLKSDEGDQEGYSVYGSALDGEGDDNFGDENPFDAVANYIGSNQSNIDTLEVQNKNLKEGVRQDQSSIHSISGDALISFIAHDLGIHDEKIDIPPALCQIYLQFYEMREIGGQPVIRPKSGIDDAKLMKFENLKFLIQGIGKVESSSWMKKISSDDKIHRLSIEGILPFYYGQYEAQNTNRLQDSAQYIMKYAIERPKEFNAIVKSRYPEGNVPNGQKFVDSCANIIDAQKLLELVWPQYSAVYGGANVYKIDPEAEIKYKVIDTKRMMFKDQVVDEKVLPNITILHKHEGLIIEYNIPKEVIEKLVKDKKLELHSPEIKERIEGKGREK